MKYFVTILLAVSPAFLQAQIPPVTIKPVLIHESDTMAQMIDTHVAEYQTLKDPENSQVVYKGLFTYRQLEMEPTFSWLPDAMDKYSPDTTTYAYLRATLPQHKLLVFMGTWCEDSQRLIPELYKLLSDLNVRYDNLVVVGMDRAKTTYTATGVALVKEYEVSLLPTIVVINSEGKETGRITETVKRSIEWDLVNIIAGRQ